MKQQFQEIKSFSKVIGINFGTLSSNEIKDISEIDILNSNLYSENGTQPAEYGLLDLRMGTSSKDLQCKTCDREWSECPGHFGKIDLSYPCFHVGFFKNILNILQCICKKCSTFLLPIDKKQVYLRKLRKPELSYVEKKNIRKAIVTDCKKVYTCLNCNAYNGVVKKCSTLKILHVKYQHDKKTKNMEALEYVQTFENVLNKDKEFQILLRKSQEVLNPLRVLELFRKIPRNDLIFCVMDQAAGVPQDLILTRILVPPCTIRPSVTSSFGNGTNEDDLTMRLMEILRTNMELKMTITERGDSKDFAAAWDHLQVLVGLLYNGQLTGVQRAVQGNKMGVIQRLKGKQGRFRGNLCGKRVNYSGRTVISPDPHLRIDQVGVPSHIAKTLTFPEMVNASNLEYYKELILKGRDVFPFVSAIRDQKGTKFQVRAEMSERLSRQLRVGDTVMRSMGDGDVVLFNRQPSLHRLSIQAFKVKVTKGRTLQFNECCCNPFNADFDGDEMNIHFPQTEEAKAEALILMESKSNMITPRNGEPLIAAIQDFITGAYLMTQKDRFFTKHQAASILSALIDTFVELPLPAIRKPVERWTGKQLFSIIMKPNSSSDVLINLRMKCGGKQTQSSTNQFACTSCKTELMRQALETYLSSTNCTICPLTLKAIDPKANPQEVLCKNCINKFKEITSSTMIELCSGCKEFNRTSTQEELDPNDNFVVIHNSQLLAGYMNKSFLGSGSKNSIFYFILRDFGKHHAADALLRLSKLTSWYIAHRGFSISFKDVAATPEILEIKRKLLDKGYTECDEYIRKFKDSELQAAPGCTEEQTLEGILLRTLSQIRDDAGNACDSLLPRNNSPIVMAVSGSKGSLINVCQMIVCVGQQSVNGKRPPNGFDNRSLYLYPKNCYEPLSKGFVENSFYSGLTTTELFFHAVAGREGLVDTAIKTSSTGYMQRRLVKTMEDTKSEYDGTVRNSRGQVIQFVYGSDGLNPCDMEAKYKKSKNSKPTNVEGIRPFDLGRVLDQICHQHPCKEEKCLKRDQVQKIYSRLRELKEYKFLKAEKLTNGGKAMEQPERARNFGRHMQKFIESLGENLDQNVVIKGAVCQRSHITRTQLEKFLSTCCNKFLSAQVEPGTAVGALAAQSIGEPGTQMTLKTFHFAGVASMDITQGVPRILEIINATKCIATPFAKCPLEKPFDEGFARLVKGRIEKTTLGEIGLHFVTTITELDLSISIKIDLRRIELLKLEINVYTIKRSILLSKLKLTDQDVKVLSKSEIVIAPKFKESPLWTLFNLQQKLPEVVVCGIATVKRVVIQAKKQKNEDGKNEYELVMEGTDKMDLKAIMTTSGVIGSKIESNSIIQIKQCLGIEAARVSIMTEMSNTMASHGIGVDMRHIMLLADTMTRGGEIMGITRSGLGKNVDSPLMLASFEKTDEHIFDAAYLGQLDPISGVSEKIIMGTNTKIGTGSFEVLQKMVGKEIIRPLMPVFDDGQVHLPSLLIQSMQKVKLEKE